MMSMETTPVYHFKSIPNSRPNGNSSSEIFIKFSASIDTLDTCLTVEQSGCYITRWTFGKNPMNLFTECGRCLCLMLSNGERLAYLPFDNSLSALCTNDDE
jgi:hypothetical protein